MVGSTVGSIGIRRVDQIRQLLRLVDRGLLSEEEFERQVLRMYVLSPEGAVTPRP